MHRNFVVAWLIENLKRQSRGKADGKGKEQVQMFYAYDYVVMNWMLHKELIDRINATFAEG